MPTSVSQYIKQINQALDDYSFGAKPPELYDPIQYIMGLGGKRLRPVFTLLAYGLFRNDEPTDQILMPALAVEVFHNFTLMHDDIMDQAPLRRGQPTVHTRWSPNVAILSGDVMLVKAYEMILQGPPGCLPEVLAAFNRCAAEVCEGQQLDMNYEQSDRVTESDYLEMIRQKTAALLGFSMQLGGILAGADQPSQDQLYQFGEQIGLGFQLMDDWLDVYADQKKFGKQIGGDIIANKKTFLLIKALEQAEGADAEQLEHWLAQSTFEPEEKVRSVKEVYRNLGVSQLTQQRMNACFEQGFRSLDALTVEDQRKESLRAFTRQLMQREK